MVYAVGWAQGVCWYEGVTYWHTSLNSHYGAFTDNFNTESTILTSLAETTHSSSCSHGVGMLARLCIGLIPLGRGGAEGPSKRDSCTL